MFSKKKSFGIQCRDDCWDKSSGWGDVQKRAIGMERLQAHCSFPQMNQTFFGLKFTDLNGFYGIFDGKWQFLTRSLSDSDHHERVGVLLVEESELSEHLRKSGIVRSRADETHGKDRWK